MMEHKKQINRLTAIILLAIIVAIASEIKVIPFEGAPFRFGLGAALFLFFILIQRLPIITTGIITGIIIILFRTFLDIFSDGAFLTSFINHFSSGLFYITFALCLKVINFENYKSRPFLLACFVTIFEAISNLVEQTFTYLFVTTIPITFKAMFLLLIVAFIRSFIVVGIYSFIVVSKQKNQVEQLLNVISNLYMETLYLQKSMNEIEKITSNSYDLYDKLKKINPSLSMQALSIAQEIHEVKKDEQRILAGLSKILETEQAQSYSISDLLQFIKEANEKYSDMFKKYIQISIFYNNNFHTREYVPLLALINNLVSNAVESIEKEGTIKISITTSEDFATIIVEDSGKGIPQKYIPIIFDPGFTTKFNSEGAPSTGIGLSHVQSIVQKLNGEIFVESNDTTRFTVKIPLEKLL